MTLEEQVYELLKKNNYKITTAESCTAGMLAARLGNVPGISGYFNEGYITYSNEVKCKRIHVEPDVIEKYGAVSKEVAFQMAEGAAKEAGADVAVSCTGIAGPGGGSERKPVGLVYIGCYVNSHTTVEEHHFAGDRQEVRKQTVEKALELVIKCVK